MAYFPNGTSGMCYEEQYCANCVHVGGEDGPGCPIMLIHNLYNYDQIGNGKTAKALHSVLDILIPETRDRLGAEQCSMFLAKVDAEAEEAEQRRLAAQAEKYETVMAEMRAARIAA